MILEHLGKLHPYEHALVLVLAFGPVMLLAVTIWIARKRRDEDD
jgi:hypothetical protein